ncbi:MAG: hypothetical protein IKF05_07795 [Erysipelotrichaceae bacterium]|nr:hypothetical protein [Erysipelotrichaceae bacterium]
MIQTETIGNFIRTYSDRGMKIHGGLPEGDYDEALDPIGSGRTYTETNIPIEDETTAEELLNILTGESE